MSLIVFTKQKILNSISMNEMDFFNMLIVMKLKPSILEWFEFSKMLE